MADKEVKLTKEEISFLLKAIWTYECEQVRKSCSRDFALEDFVDKLKDKLSD